MSILGIPDKRLFALIEPIDVTDAMFDANGADGNLSEPDTTNGDPPDEWSAATAYVAGDRVYWTHAIYERSAAGTTATEPQSDEDNWTYVSATNAWKMFEIDSSSQTLGPSDADLTFEVLLDSTHDIDRIGFDNTDAIDITVEVWNAGKTEQYYTRTITLRGYDPDRAWAIKRACVFDELPTMTSKLVVVTATRPSSGVGARIGSMILGHLRVLGIAQSGFSTGITDFSNTAQDDFGHYTAVIRNYSKRMSGTLLLESRTIDAITGVLAYNRGRIVMYVAVGNNYAATIMCGFWKNFDITVPGPIWSYCSIDVQGVA